MFELHLTEEQFWDLHPTVFAKMTERWVVGVEREKRKTANILLVLANLLGTPKKGGQKWTVDDFMPENPEKEEDPMQKQLELSAKMAEFAACYTKPGTHIQVRE